MKSMKFCSVISLFFLSISTISAQSTAFMTNWHFGHYSGLSFASGAPVALPGSTMISIEGCVSHSDNLGNLLFYSDGGKENSMLTAPGGVRNANHQLMPNGEMSSNEGGCDSSPQSSLVIHKGGTEYYLFTIGCTNGVGLKKSIIDMSLDNGLGDVTLKGDPIQGLSSFLAEGLTATKHANGIDHWLIVHSSGGNSYYVFLITSTGITGPTTYNVGSGVGNFGQIKVSVQGDKIAFNTEVLDFDNSTGVISNPDVLGTESFWARAFSATGDYLYMRTIMGEMYQYDMNAVNIGASKVLLASNIIAAGNLQLGPDLKIYGASNGAQYLSAIKYPELAGLACDYEVNHVLLPGINSCNMGLPNFIDSELRFLLNTKVLKTENVISVFYPNPTASEIYFNSEIDKSELLITTLDGRIIRDWTLIGKSMNVEALSKGVYVMHYHGKTSRFIKQ